LSGITYAQHRSLKDLIVLPRMHILRPIWQWHRIGPIFSKPHRPRWLCTRVCYVICYQLTPVNG